MYHWTGSAAGAGRPVVVEVVAVAGSGASLCCAATCELRAAAPRCSGLVAPSGTRGMGNPAAVKRF